MYTRVLSLVYPPVCPFCNRVQSIDSRIEDRICHSCMDTLPWIIDAYCMRCGKKLQDQSMEYCRDCSRNHYAFTEGRALFVHTEKVAQAIYLLKFHHHKEYGQILGSTLAKQFCNTMRRWKVTEVIPIPLHYKKYRMRGYNQAELIASALVNESKGVLSLNNDTVYRVKHTKPQKGMKISQRNRNLTGAFAIRKDWVPCERVLLVDDIYTTGNTLHKVASLLKKVGVQEVYYLTVSIGQGL